MSLIRARIVWLELLSVLHWRSQVDGTKLMVAEVRGAGVKFTVPADDWIWKRSRSVQGGAAHAWVTGLKSGSETFAWNVVNSWKVPALSSCAVSDASHVTVHVAPGGIVTTSLGMPRALPSRYRGATIVLVPSTNVNVMLKQSGGMMRSEALPVFLRVTSVQMEPTFVCWTIDDVWATFWQASPTRSWLVSAWVGLATLTQLSQASPTPSPSRSS